MKSSALLTLVTLFAAGSAQALDTATTLLVTDRCQVTARETEDEAGDPLPKRDQFASAW